MGIRALGRYRDEASEDRWRDPPDRLVVGGSGEAPSEFIDAAFAAMKAKPAESLRREDLAKPLDRAQHLLLR